jgi:hypothetical protein
MSIIQAINNPEMLVGLILVIISVVGLVGGNVSVGTFTFSFRTARGFANVVLLGVLLVGIGTILKELFWN